MMVTMVVIITGTSMSSEHAIPIIGMRVAIQRAPSGTEDRPINV
jgi:hypothetical protein